MVCLVLKRVDPYERHVLNYQGCHPPLGIITKGKQAQATRLQQMMIMECEATHTQDDIVEFPYFYGVIRKKTPEHCRSFMLVGYSLFFLMLEREGGYYCLRHQNLVFGMWYPLITIHCLSHVSILNSLVTCNHDHSSLFSYSTFRLFYCASQNSTHISSMNEKRLVAVNIPK